MTTEINFEALRIRRNEEVLRSIQKIAEELDCPVNGLKTTFNPNACYCACTSKGPCEHKWDGEPYESGDGSCWSVTCSRCGMTAMSHDMRVLP